MLQYPCVSTLGKAQLDIGYMMYMYIVYIYTIFVCVSFIINKLHICSVDAFGHTLAASTERWGTFCFRPGFPQDPQLQIWMSTLDLETHDLVQLSGT